MTIGMIIPRDKGWLPHWDEALDESIGINEALYFTTLLWRGLGPLYKYVMKYKTSFIPFDSSKASSQRGNQPPSIGMKSS